MSECYPCSTRGPGGEVLLVAPISVRLAGGWCVFGRYGVLGVEFHIKRQQLVGEGINC